MSEHNLILEFYKPTYNLDFDYDGDGGLDLHFTNIKGEFFMTMNDSYNSVYIEDEDCEFSKGEMFATVDLGDLVERIINGEFRQTNGKAISDWDKRFIGDGEEQIEFNGNNYADGSLFWDDFFNEMPKDEIKDFMIFCEDYLDLPNIEFDTVSDKYDFENGKVELKSNGKWGITVNDDCTIISVDKFTCNSTDACDAYYVASSESDEDNYYESKKSARKSLKESKVDFQSVIDRVLPKEYAKNKNAYRYALSCVTSLYNEDEYDSDSAKVYFLNCYISDLFPSWVDELGEEEIDVFANALYYGTMKWSDIDSSWFESEKSARKSLKEEIMSTKLFRFIQDLYDLHYITEEQLNKFKTHDFSKKEIKVLEQNYEIYKTSNEFDEINNAIKSTVNMINSFKESLKEYLVKGLDVDFVVDHLLSLEDLDNIDLINKLGDLWEVYKKSWSKFNKSLSDFWKVMKNIEKLDSFDDTCKEIIDAWYDDIEKIFYSDDNLENLKLNYGFEGNDVF